MAFCGCFSMDEFDEWQNLHRLIDEAEQATLHTQLIIESIEGVAPLDTQMGIWPIKTVPDALYEPLFGQPKPTDEEISLYGSMNNVPPLKTYAILDAAKVPFMTVYLERSELPYKCVFKGNAEEEFKDAAPYIVELSDNNDFTRNLFTAAGMPSNMWDCEPGIYIRSRASLENLWKHFRKFTKARDRNGKWYYLRYWEPAFFVDYALSLRPEKQTTFIGDCEAFVIVRKKGKCRVAKLNHPRPFHLIP